MYKKQLIKQTIAFMTFLAIASVFVSEARAQKDSKEALHNRIVKQVRNELATLPYYGR